MLIKPDDGGETYDRFRGRLMIPIRDARGRVIAFGGRILGRRRAEISQQPRNRRSSTRAAPSTISTAPRPPAAPPSGSSSSKAIWTSSRSTAPASRRSSPPTAPRSPKRSSSGCGGSIPRPCSASTAMRRARKRRSARPCARCPYVGPDRTLRFVTMPAGEDPDDVVKKGGRAAFEALVDAAEPLVERLWRHERDAAPLATPEERASLKARLMAHAGTIGDGSVRSLYRDEWLSRFDTLFARAQPQRREWKPGKWKPGQRGGYVPAPAPMGQVARAIGKGGIDRATARAMIAGFAYFPEALAAHAETLAVPADRRSARRQACAITWSMRSWPAPRLIGRASIPYWRPRERQPALKDVRRSGGIGFSFTRSDSGSRTRDARPGCCDRGAGGRGRNRSGARRGHGTAESG